MPLYGHEITEEITPVQAGQQWALKFSKGDFTGKAALQQQQEDDTYRRIVGLVMTGRVPAREGYAVLQNDSIVGEVRSGSLGPSVQNQNIATALVDKDASEAGTVLQIQVRGTKHDAIVPPLPFYKRAK